MTHSRPRPRDSRPTGRQQIGVHGEDLAAAELERQGMQLLARNWRCRAGELDIVALERTGDCSTVVFCEVKCRTGLGFGDPLESITWTKLRKLRALAAEWLAVAWPAAQAEAGGDPASTSRPAAIRLDAIGVTLLPGEAPQLSHVRGIG